LTKKFPMTPDTTMSIYLSIRIVSGQIEPLPRIESVGFRHQAGIAG
jgi:hypothetical protein